VRKIDFVKASLTWLPSCDSAYFLADSITLFSCGSHIEKLVTTSQLGGSGCCAVGKKHLRFGRHCSITSSVISIKQPVNNIVNSRRVFSSKLYSVKQSKVSKLLSVLSHVTFMMTSIITSLKTF